MIQIIAFEGRWVFVGKVTETETDYIFENGANIRYWGTSRGLGELASGPTKSTKLDPMPKHSLPKSKRITTIEVDQDAWAKALDELH